MYTPDNMSLWPRQLSGVSGEVDNIKHTLSSWDSCMSKAFCKWPVIAAIIIGSLIILSLLACLFRCLCCGLECCCGCFRCCNACCPSPRRSRGEKYEPAPQQPYGPPQPYGYQAQPPMQYGAPAFQQQQQPPQFASFESSGARDGKTARYNEDSLPAMPSWSNARERKVEDDTPIEEDKDSIPLQDQKPLNGERDPMLPTVAAMPTNPSRTASPFHSPNSQQSPFHPPPGQSPYGPPPAGFGGPSRSQSPYGPGSNQSHAPQHDEYPAAEFPPNEYPAAAAAAGGAYAAGAYGGGHRSPQPPQQRSPGPYVNTGYGHGQGYPGRVPEGAMELPSESSPTSPGASSVYTSNTYHNGPAPSYHTQAAPMPGVGPIHRQDSYSRPFGGQRSPPPPQQYGGYSAYTPYNQPSELDNGSGRSPVERQRQGPYGPQQTDSWGGGEGRPRKPVTGNWRDV